MRKAVKAEGVTTNTNAVRRIGFSLQYDCLSAIIAPTKHHHFVTPIVPHAVKPYVLSCMLEVARSMRGSITLFCSLLQITTFVQCLHQLHHECTTANLAVVSAFWSCR